MKRRFACLVALVLAAAPLAARAEITCTASNITLNFGNYDPLSDVPLDAAGSVQITCQQSALLAGSATVNYFVELSRTPPNRQLKPPAGPDRLSYEVYVDPARTQPWGDGSAGTFRITGTVTVPGSIIFLPGTVTDTKNFYARIAPGGQDVSPATYTHQLNVTTRCSAC